MSGSVDFSEVGDKLRQAPIVAVFREERSGVDEAALVRMAASEQSITARVHTSVASKIGASS